MKTMEEFFTEAFDSPAKIARIEDSGKRHKAYFAIGSDVYRIDFHKKRNGIVVEFSMNDGHSSTYSLTDRGVSMKVFATVLQHIRDYVAAHQPKTIEFSAHHNFYDPETGKLVATGRSKLYKRMAKRFASELGYDVTATEQTGSKRSKAGMVMKARSKILGLIDGHKKMTGIHDITHFKMTKKGA